jgi:CelD/BcsL family acetyltransferase involved in cellulose biosynthesis
LQLEDVFEIERHGEAERYLPHKKSVQHRRLLWHGSRLTNYAGILSQGGWRRGEKEGRGAVALHNEQNQRTVPFVF